MVLDQLAHRGSELSFNIPAVSEHSPLLKAIQNTSISNEPLQAYSLEHVIIKFSLSIRCMNHRNNIHC
jgi:hypothetical protein